MNTPVKNDSLFSARNLTFVFLALAIGISSYLSYLKFDTSASPACSVGAVFDCGTVLNSVYSEIGGVPIAYLGLATNLIVLALLILEPRVQFFTNFTVPLVFGIMLFATLFSVYLIYVQAFLITKYCPWCLSHEFFVFMVFGFSTKRLLQWMDSQAVSDDVEMSAV